VIKLFTTIFVFATTALFLSADVFAQEEVIEVGKHANPNIDALSMIMSLLMVLVLIIVSAWVLKKFNVVNKSVSGMKVITSLPLGHKEKLVVVQVANEQLLLGVSSQQINLIKTLDEPIELNKPVSQELGQTLNRLFTRSSIEQSESPIVSKPTSPNKHSEKQYSSNKQSVNKQS
jgi:flagellar protein FliO/FliZ